MASDMPIRRTFFVGEGLDAHFIRLRWSDPEPVTWIDVEIFRVVSEKDGQPMFLNAPEMGPEMSTEARIPEIDGFVKWDGCTQLGFTDRDHLAMHFDGDEQIVQMCDAIREARRVALVDVMNGAEYL